MLSIIICSRTNSLPSSFSKNIQSTVGIPYELILIDNSNNQYSIFSAYNEGIKQSKHPYLCFVHDDVRFHTSDWGEKIISHLQKPNVGLIGVAGGDMVGQVPSYWYALNRSINIIQSDKTRIIPTHHLYEPEDYQECSRSVVLLDGVFLCAKKQIFDRISFDETIGGFHAYDLDISLQSYFAGFKNYVIYDVLLEHLSLGVAGQAYYLNTIKVHKKWEKKLPVFEQSISENEIKRTRLSLEEKKLERLKKKMIRSHFSISYTAEIANEYAKLIGSKRINRIKILLKIHLFLIKIVSKIRGKIK
jgi:glycosyltransferase involved in cell wall biosynthesis